MASARIECLMTECGIGHPVIRPSLTPDDGWLGRIAVNVAGARAIGQLAPGVQKSLDCLRMSLRLEIPRMAATAAARFGGSGICDGLGVGRVTLSAAQCGMVLSRVLWSRMPEIDRIPVGIRVAGDAFACRAHVVGRLANRSGVVMTRGASSRQH